MKHQKNRNETSKKTEMKHQKNRNETSKKTEMNVKIQ
jgi:hypothetical protein